MGEINYCNMDERTNEEKLLSILISESDEKVQTHIDVQAKEIERLREELKKNWKHTHQCQYRQYSNDCTCGLDKALESE